MGCANSNINCANSSIRDDCVSERSFEISYKIVREIGAGAFSTVFEVSENTTKQHYAVKKVMRQQKDDLLTEARILKSLKHPNIISFKEFFQFVNKLHPNIQWTNATEK